jgi:ABC-type antimicrobial peptide transport system permease subunit
VPDISRFFIQEDISDYRASRWHIFRHQTPALIGLIVLISILLLTLLSPIITDDPNVQNLDSALIPPSWHVDGTPEHLLGTDILGRDLFSRLLNGASQTIGIALLTVATALLIGLFLGVLAATLNATVQLVIMRTIDVLMAIPALILAIVVVAITGPGLINAGIAVTVVLIPRFVKFTRNIIIEEMNKDYVAAARLDGAKPDRILMHIIMPNISAPLVIQTTLALSAAIIDIAALGFLGIGAQAPLAEWGLMLAEARTSLFVAPWSVTAPGFAILITVFCINLVGEGLNTVFNPKSSY